MTRNSPRTYSYAARIAFVVELAEHLHAYGTTAQRFGHPSMITIQSLWYEPFMLTSLDLAFILIRFS